MKLSTVLATFSAAIVSSRTVAVPDSSDDVQDVSVVDGATPPTGEKIPGENSFNLCKGDRSNDVITINQVDLVPNPPIRGQDLVVFATGTVNEPIVQGAVLDVKLGQLGQSCPVVPGDVLFNESWPIPKKGFPHGKYGINAFARFPDGRPISCVDGSLKM